MNLNCVFVADFSLHMDTFILQRKLIENISITGNNFNFINYQTPKEEITGIDNDSSIVDLCHDGTYDKLKNKIHIVIITFIKLINNIIRIINHHYIYIQIKYWSPVKGDRLSLRKSLSIRTMIR